jgi:kumamolisin
MALRPYCTNHTEIAPKLNVSPKTTNPYAPYFTSKMMASIYNFPTPVTSPIIIGVISVGGGLYGTVTGNILTAGDVQSYWSAIGIPSESQPKVVIVPVGGGTNSPASDTNATIENTIDVETVGSCCPGANVTIVFFIAPNTFSGFYNAFYQAIHIPTSVNGSYVKPSIISCSWGAPESVYGLASLNQFNTLFQTASSNGVNICCASGDNGSSDGLRGLNVDFPSSSPYVVACGGTTLRCPNVTYDSQTVETAWSGSGGGMSKYFLAPRYQTNIRNATRSSPDISMNANPSTGVIYRVNTVDMVVGGTSIVSPAVSAFLGAINYSGFFTPRLYSLPSSVFHDVVSGSNGAYSGKSGFDLTTGWGSFSGTAIQTQVSSWVSVTSVSLTPASATLKTNATLQLRATVLPSNASNKTVVWTSSNAALMSVTSSGLLRRLRPGAVIIRATTNDGWLVGSCVCT